MLWVCATPIGNLGDVTPRLLEALRAADLVAAEDTRHTRKLLSHFDIHTPLTSLFRAQRGAEDRGDPGSAARREERGAGERRGHAGRLGPGQRLVARAAAEGAELTVLPGPSAVLTALVAAGYEGDGFRFVGYLPRRPATWRRSSKAGAGAAAWWSPSRPRLVWRAASQFWRRSRQMCASRYAAS